MWASFRKRYEKAGGDAPGDYFAYLDEGLFSIKSALAKMRLEAKHDLK